MGPLAHRIIRALTWGILAGGGIAGGLAAGSSLASTPADGQMLSQLGFIVGAAGALIGFALPVKAKKAD